MLAAQKDLARVYRRGLAVAIADPEVSEFKREFYKIDSIDFAVNAGVDVEYEESEVHSIRLDLHPEAAHAVSRIAFKVSADPLNAPSGTSIEIVRLPFENGNTAQSAPIELIATFRSDQPVDATNKRARIELAQAGHEQGTIAVKSVSFDVMNRIRISFDARMRELTASGTAGSVGLPFADQSYNDDLYIRVVLLQPFPKQETSVAPPLSATQTPRPPPISDAPASSWIVLIERWEWPPGAARQTVFVPAPVNA
jgi:hypothetical protein